VPIKTQTIEVQNAHDPRTQFKVVVFQALKIMVFYAQMNLLFELQYDETI
jgi:hypothetical protein